MVSTEGGKQYWRNNVLRGVSPLSRVSPLSLKDTKPHEVLLCAASCLGVFVAKQARKAKGGPTACWLPPYVYLRPGLTAQRASAPIGLLQARLRCWNKAASRALPLSPLSPG